MLIFVSQAPSKIVVILSCPCG